MMVKSIKVSIKAHDMIYLIIYILIDAPCM